jgi:hypothetical protein
VVAATLSSGPVPVSSAGRPANGGSRAEVDVDGDGRADLLIGSIHALNVEYGDGVRQRITEEALPPRRDFGGFTGDIAACDVNGDGFTDAVLTAAYADVAGTQSAGRVVVLYGAASGLAPRRASVISQSSPGVPGRSETFDLFGMAVECGHINGDRFDDLTVGVPGESWRVGPVLHDRLGRVVVVPGGAGGVVTTRSWAFNQDSPGIPDRPEQGDGFGSTLLMDDVTGDGWDDLIVWAQEGEGLIGEYPGALFTLPGTRSGVHARGTAVIYGQTNGLPRLAGPIVAGNLDRHGPRDVAVGSLHEWRSGFAGAVTMLHGTPSGLTATRSRTIRRDSPGMPHVAPGRFYFGGRGPLAAGDVDGDGDDDVLVGSLSETVGGHFEAGRVFVLRATTGGITTAGVQQFTQDTPGVPGRAHWGGHFGHCLELVDLDGNGRTEAAIASGERSDDPEISVGAVTILRATPSGLTGRGARRLNPADFGATTHSGGVGFGCGLKG